MAIQKIKRMPVFVAMIILLFAAGISFASHFKALKTGGANVAFADDDERDSEESEDRDEHEDENDDEDKDDEDKDEVDENDDEDNRGAITEQRTFTKEDDEDENEAEEADDEADDNDAAEEIAELNKDINKVEKKIAILEAAGQDVTSIRAALDEIKAMASDAQSKLGKGDLAGAEATVEEADDRLESVEHSIEVFLGDDEDEEKGDDDQEDAEKVAKKYKNAVAEFVHELQAIGVEGGLGQQVKVVAQAQNQNKEVVSNLISDVDARGKVLSFIFGPDYKSLDKIKQQIATNESSIQALATTLAQIQDPYVKTVLQAQIKVLQQENERLQSFVQTTQDQPSVFGWFMRMLQ